MIVINTVQLYVIKHKMHFSLSITAGWWLYCFYIRMNSIDVIMVQEISMDTSLGLMILPHPSQLKPPAVFFIGLTVAHLIFT